VARYEIVGDHTRFDVTLRPSLPDLRVRVPEVSGSLEATLTPDGMLDLAHPVAGRLEVRLTGLHTNNRLLATGLEHLLGDDVETSARVDITGARDHGPGTYAFALTTIVASRDAAMTGIGRIEIADDGRPEIVGHTRCDPRAFGAPLPPMVNLTVNVRWHVRLRAAPV
jgi:hypothetical protein